MEELTSPEYTYDPGLRDQNALSYLLKRDWKKNMPHVELVNRQYCLNCYWRDLLELGTLTSDDTRVWEPPMTVKVPCGAHHCRAHHVQACQFRVFA